MDKKVPYFSIILPIYNVASYLDACIESVQEQKFADYELILVDDGSTDICPEICDWYAAKYDHIRVIHKTNGGLSSARNAGLEIACGQYIWWVDSDDWIAQDSLQTLYEACCGDQPDIVKFPHFRAGEQIKRASFGVNTGVYKRPEELQWLQNQAFHYPGKYGLSAWSHVYKKELLDRTGCSFVSERTVGSEDYLFNLNVLVAAESVQVIDVPLYFYRLREGSLTKRYRCNLADQYAELFNRLCVSFDQRGILSQYEEKISSFYVWHLVHGTFFGHEYRPMDGHTISQGRKNVRRILASDTVQYAVNHCSKTGLQWKQRIQLAAMRMKIEPLFYWLFVVKPGAKEGKHHENKD